MARKKPTRYLANIESPMPGVAIYYTEGGACVMPLHYSADHLKDDAWVGENARGYAGGTTSAAWLQEFELDDQAEDGLLVYSAFDRIRHVIPAITPLPATWPISIGVDWGQTAPTAVVFIAQDPLTRKCYVFDLIYQPNGIGGGIERLIYERIADCRGVSVKEVLMTGIDRWIDRAVGDPSGTAFRDAWAQGSFPVNIATNLENLKINDVRAGEAQVNEGLTPAVICCGMRQYNPTGNSWESFACVECLEMRVPEPLIYIFDGRAEELVEQWESLMRKRAQVDDILGVLETPETNIKAADHAADGARYIFRVVDYDPSDEAPRKCSEILLDRMVEKKQRLGHLAPEEEIELMMLENRAAQDRREREASMQNSPTMWIGNRHQVGSNQGKHGYGLRIH